MKIKFAEKCAWRAIYVNGDRRQICAVILDPWNGVKPTLSLIWLGRRLNIPMPRLRYRFPAGPVRMALYRVSQRFWHKVDGRYSS